MRDVAQQLALGRQQRFDAFRHAVEIATELGKLVAAASIATDACAEVAFSELTRRHAEPLNRRRQVARQRVADQPRGEEHGQQAHGERTRLLDPRSESRVPRPGPSASPSPLAVEPTVAAAAPRLIRRSG